MKIKQPDKPTEESAEDIMRAFGAFNKCVAVLESETDETRARIIRTLAVFYDVK